MKRAILLSVIVVAFMVAGQSVAEGAEWVKYRDSAAGEHFYDKESISSVSRDVVRVSKKLLYSEEDRLKIIELRKKEGLSTRKYRNLSYEVSLLEINCVTRESSSVSRTEHDINGSILFAATPSPREREWAPVVPESERYSLYVIVCRNK